MTRVHLLNAEAPAPGAQSARWLFAALLSLFVLYAAAFIARTSFEVNGVRYFCLFDDAMISMRYAKNLAHGFGLVWNPGGERVEGFTNPLWVGYMALFHLFAIPPAKISVFLQASGALCLLLTLFYVRKIAAHLIPDSRLGQVVPVFLTAFYVPLVNWSLQGMEVGVLALIVTIAFWQTLHVPGADKTPWHLYLLLAAGTFVRIDFVPVALVLLSALVIVDTRKRKPHLLVGGSILVLGLVLQTAMRYAYFGELLPNTYYLKMTGISLIQRIQRGAGAFAGFASGMTWILFLFPFTVFLLKRQWSIALAAGLFLVQCAYSIFVGGDAWEWWGGSNRYIAIVMPCFFILFGFALAQWKSVLEHAAGAGSGAMRGGAIAVVCVLLVLSYFGLNNVRGVAGISEWSNGVTHLLSSAPGRTSGGGSAGIGDVAEWLVVPVPLERDENVRMVHASVLMDSITAPGARVGVTLAGALPYLADRTYIDLLGKNDKIIARLPARSTIDPMGKVSFTPGHSKWNYAYSIGELKPDLVFQLWAEGSEARPYLDAEYEEVEIQDQVMFFRRGSQAVRWDAVKRMSRREF